VATLVEVFSDSLRSAWNRTAGLLWRPFDAKSWIVLAFAQFLATLPPDAWGGGGVGGSDRDWSRTGEEIESAWERLAVGGLIVALVIFGLTLLLVVVLALLWVSSRAKFVFLDDVVSGRAQIAEPWRRFRREGNSLFWFRIALFLAGCVLVAIALLTIVSSVGLGALLRGQPGKITALVLFVLGFVGFLFVPLGYAVFFLDAFVVPLMHRHRVGALDAWRRFSALLRARPLPFLVVGLAALAAFVVFGVSVLVFGFMTCCLGFLLLMTPYLSNLLLLPLTVLYRSFTLEFLSRFDGDLLPRPGGA
jgi:hypothetical protein